MAQFSFSVFIKYGGIGKMHSLRPPQSPAKSCPNLPCRRCGRAASSQYGFTVLSALCFGALPFPTQTANQTPASVFWLQRAGRRRLQKPFPAALRNRRQPCGSLAAALGRFRRRGRGRFTGGRAPYQARYFFRVARTAPGPASSSTKMASILSARGVLVKSLPKMEALAKISRSWPL